MPSLPFQPLLCQAYLQEEWSLAGRDGKPQSCLWNSASLPHLGQKARLRDKGRQVPAGIDTKPTVTNELPVPTGRQGGQRGDCSILGSMGTGVGV